MREKYLLFSFFKEKKRKKIKMTTAETKKIYKAETEICEKVSKNTYYIEFGCEFPVYVKPGQFISIYCDGLTFRRPFSVYSNTDGKIGVLFKERGKGTEYIKSLKKGDIADIAGPFGNGFEIKNKKSLLIGAGIGVAPVAFLKSKLDKEKIENKFLTGYLTKDEIYPDINSDEIYTDDGSFGTKGFVVSKLNEKINEFKPEIIYVCGPFPVLKTVAQKANEYNIEAQIAMEKVMACGIGVCRGCVIKTYKNGEIVNSSVCKDGPVFDSKSIVWEELC